MVNIETFLVVIPVMKSLQLNDEGQYTLFAPTNSAFEDLKPGLKDKILKGHRCGIGKIALLRTNFIFLFLCCSHLLLAIAVSFHVRRFYFSSEILRQHLLPNVICSAVTENRALTKNVLDRYVTLSRSAGKLMVNDAEITQSDIMGTNGVIHVIDKVLIPEDGVNLLLRCVLLIETSCYIIC